MRRFASWLCVLFSMLCGPVVAAEETITPTAIVSPAKAGFAENLAAKEIRRYVYLRTGKLLPIVENLDTAGGPAILLAKVDGLAPQQYRLTTTRIGQRPVVLVAGGDAIGTLYGAYRLAEHLGVRFYMHGDVVPDGQIPLAISRLDETGKPLFEHRGIQPFHDFPEGPDWWNADAYKAVLGQLPKMRMNFFGLHTYPQGGVGPEPAVWIGPRSEISADGKVKASYPSRHFTTSNITGAWGYRPMKTSDYVFGAADLYDCDDFGPDYMRGTQPWNQMSAEASNALFDRMGGVLRDAFGFARQVGIKTCIGTETPLVIPDAVKKRLQAAGKNPSDPSVVQEVYAGMFQRIAQTHPVDYYWLWTPEGWTWEAVAQPQIDATLADFRAALAATNQTKVPFTLATCGWVLGPPQSPSLFDTALPKTMPMSCISRQVGNSPVEAGFTAVKGRPKWSIPWMEDDPGMVLPQLWAGRMRRDTADSLAYGCTGLMGIHWRTRILAPNVSALAKAAWDQKGWNRDYAADLAPTGGSGKPRYLPVDDFYVDWARAEFGPQAAEGLAAIFSRIDGKLPRPGDWTDGPGGIKPDARPWQEVSKLYGFVDEMAALQPKIEGLGNLERFNYWLNNFRYLRAMAHVVCTWARFDAAMQKALAEKEGEARKKVARDVVLPIRQELVAQAAEMHGYLMATVSTYGELGNVTNWQQHNFPVLLTKPGEELAKLLGETLPAQALPGKSFTGDARLVVPVVRTGIRSGEPLRLTAMVVGTTPTEVAIYWRPLGKGTFRKMPMEHANRNVYTATLDATVTGADFEYYLQGSLPGGKTLVWPATVPALNQSVVTIKE